MEHTAPVLPEDITTISREELSALLDEFIAAFDVLNGDETARIEQFDTLTEYAEGVKTIRARIADVDAELAVKADALATLAADVHPAEPETEDEPETEEEPAEEPVEEAVVAAAPVRPSMARVNKTAPSARAPRGATHAAHSLVAAAGFGTHQSGENISMVQAAELFAERFRGLPKSGAGRHVLPFARLNLDHGPALTASMSDDELIAVATDETRLPGGSLVASGVGWAAPSETDYSVSGAGESLDGIYSFPEFPVNRGGIKLVRGFTFADVGTVGFRQTEAQNIAGVKKTSNEVKVPDPWVEARLEAEGYDYRGGILQQLGWPEQVAQWLDVAMVRFQHDMAANEIVKVAAGSTAITCNPLGKSAAANLLAAMEFHAQSIRTKYRLPQSASLEAKIPFWVKNVLRQDIALRPARVSPEVSDAEIMGWFTQRGIAPQFGYNWQDIAMTDTGFAAEAKVIMYPAGVWARGVKPVINLNALYDSELLSENKELLAFFEQGRLIVRKGHESRLLTIPIPIDGVTGAPFAFGADD
jgi:hypothetical protein